MSGIRRRDFVILLGGAAAAWPHAALAQQARRMRRIGVLIGFAAASSSSPWAAAFVQRLRELGWIDGRTIAIKRKTIERLALLNL